MVRVNLTVKNETELPSAVNMTQVADLSCPINASTVNVVKFSIPNLETPLCEWPTNYYKIAVAYNDYTSVGACNLIDRGKGAVVDSIEQVLEAFNQAVAEAMGNLGIQVPLPDGSGTPFLTWDNGNNVFTWTTTNHFMKAGPFPPGLAPVVEDLQIELWFNDASARIFKSMDTSKLGGNGELSEAGMTSRLNPTPLTYNGTDQLCHVTQTSSTIAAWVDPRTIYVSTFMPIQNEIFASTSHNSGQTYEYIMASYTIPWENGLKDALTNFDFTTVTNGYRSTGINGMAMRTVKCDIYYETRRGERKQFYLSPGSSAYLLLDFE